MYHNTGNRHLLHGEISREITVVIENISNISGAQLQPVLIQIRDYTSPTLSQMINFVKVVERARAEGAVSLHAMYMCMYRNLPNIYARTLQRLQGRSLESLRYMVVRIYSVKLLIFAESFSSLYPRYGPHWRDADLLLGEGLPPHWSSRYRRNPTSATGIDRNEGAGGWSGEICCVCEGQHSP